MRTTPESSTLLSSTATALKILKDVAETLTNVPYIKTIAGVSIQILEIKDQISSNKDLCYQLINNIANRSMALVEALEQLKTNSDVKLKDMEKDLERYKNLLIDIHNSLLGLTAVGLAKAIIKRDEVKKNLQDYSSRLTEFDSIFFFTRLVNIEAKIDRIDTRVAGVPNLPVAMSLAPPPPPSSFFTGRDDVLSKMDTYFSTSSVASKRQRVFALYGMGGAGKTQIALKFIENCSERFSRIYFVDASTIESLTTTFENIASDTRLPQPTVAATLRWLSTLREEWLLIFDNADDPSIDLRSFIPKCTHGNIIITSRNPQMRRHAPEGYHHVGGLELPEATSLLLHSSMLPQEADEARVRGLVEELGFLALAIVQAGAFISSSPGMSFEDYLQLYKSNKTELLRQHPSQTVDGYQWTVYTTWEMSFGKLDDLAAQVLQLSSYWHHDKIPKALFRRALRLVDKSGYPDGWDSVASFLDNFRGPNGQWNELTFQRVMNQLNSFSLITSSWNDSYSIHPLVHSWARDRDTDHGYYTILAARLLGLCVPDRAFRTTISPHVRKWMSLQSDIYPYLDAELASRFYKIWAHVLRMGVINRIYNESGSVTR